MPLLEVKNLSISFSGIQILHEINFSVDEGEINCLCGENGAGKSTLVKVLSGIYSDYSGEILIQNKAVSLTAPTDAVKYGIFAVQQHRDLAPSLSSVENMFLCNEIYIGKNRQRLDFVKMHELAKEYVSKFGIEIDLDVPVRELKVSEQGVIAICKALVRNCKILLIDEASAPLDDEERRALYTSLQKLAKEGTAIVYITHHLDEVFKIGNSVTVLRDGRNVGKFLVSEIDKSKLIASMIGDVHLYSRELGEQKSLSDENMLEVNHLSAKGLNDVSFFVKSGEILGIAGLEGSGKNLIALSCFGFSKIQKGEIRLKNKKINLKSPLDAIKNNIGLIPDNRKEAGLVLSKDISDNIIITYLNKYDQQIISGREITKIARNYINKLRIKCVGPSQLVEYLSGGNQQKVLVSKWLQSQVDVLFMNEPTEGIDVAARADLYEIFRELAREGKAIIIATSDIDELLELSDRILTMANGIIINEYRIEEADKQVILSDVLSAA
jgi:ribose transport system ATP-binding protein